jgi:hypothetical protein
MASNIAQRFYDLLRKHFETGVPWQNMAFTDEQKKRVEVCLDAYKRFEEDPFMNLRQYIINRWKRTYSQLGGDLKVIDFISSFYAKGQRNISSMKVRHAADLMMRNGADTGDMKAVYNGASLLTKIDRLDQPETPEELCDELIRMPVVITSDVKKKFPNKTGHDSEEMRRLRKKYGVKLDQWQEMVEDDDGVYVIEGQNGPEEDYNEVNRDDFTQPEEEE